MLARTTKVFREYLMTRRSALVWKTARGNVEDIPDCPPYLAEPFYAELMFGVDCQVSICAYYLFFPEACSSGTVAQSKTSSLYGISISAAVGRADIGCVLLPHTAVSSLTCTPQLSKRREV